MIEDLLIEFDEMGFAPTTLCENPEKYAVEWKKRLVAEIDKFQTACKSEWVHLPFKKGDVLERNGERCKVDHWNVFATAFTKDNKLRLFGVEEAVKSLEDMRKECEGK